MRSMLTRQRQHETINYLIQYSWNRLIFLCVYCIVCVFVCWLFRFVLFVVVDLSLSLFSYICLCISLLLHAAWRVLSLYNEEQLKKKDAAQDKYTYFTGEKNTQKQSAAHKYYIKTCDLQKSNLGCYMLTMTLWTLEKNSQLAFIFHQ